MTDALSIACGPADARGHRLVVATLGRRSHRDRFDVDSDFHRRKFRDAVVERFGFSDDAHEALEAQLISAADAEDAAADSATIGSPRIVRLSDVAPADVEWLWPGRIALGKLTLLAGDPGLGKSFLGCDVAARVSTGAAWPDAPRESQTPGGVVLLSAEDDLADTIRPRLDAHGADVSRIVALESIVVRDLAGDLRRGIDLSRDLPAIEAAIAEARGCRLVIIDPVSAYLGRTDSHNNSEVRGVLERLADLAERRRVAVLAITHLRKGEGPAMYRAMGSLAFVAAARAAWAVCKDAEHERRRLVLPIKNNLAPDAGGLAFEIGTYGLANSPAVAWEAAPVTISADAALASPLRRRGPEATATADAAEWLGEYLADGPQPQREVREAAEAHGISYSTLRRAFRDLGGQASKDGFSGGWRWSLGSAAEGAHEGAHVALPQTTWTPSQKPERLRVKPEENGHRQGAQNGVVAQGAQVSKGYYGGDRQAAEAAWLDASY